MNWQPEGQDIQFLAAPAAQQFGQVGQQFGFDPAFAQQAAQLAGVPPPPAQPVATQFAQPYFQQGAQQAFPDNPFAQAAAQQAAQNAFQPYAQQFQPYAQQAQPFAQQLQPFAQQNPQLDAFAQPFYQQPQPVVMPIGKRAPEKKRSCC